MSLLVMSTILSVISIVIISKAIISIVVVSTFHVMNYEEQF
jgi:hypothetical protein